MIPWPLVVGFGLPAAVLFFTAGWIFNDLNRTRP